VTKRPILLPLGLLQCRPRDFSFLVAFFLTRVPSRRFEVVFYQPSCDSPGASYVQLCLGYMLLDRSFPVTFSPQLFVLTSRLRHSPSHFPVVFERCEGSSRLPSYAWLLKAGCPSTPPYPEFTAIRFSPNRPIRVRLDKREMDGTGPLPSHAAAVTANLTTSPIATNGY